jgi:hypothetical protein
VVRRFAFGLVAGFSRRSRFAAGICSGLVRMIATMRSLNSSTVSTGRCCRIRFCDEFVMKLSQILVLQWQRVRESKPISAFRVLARFWWNLTPISALTALRENRHFAQFVQNYAV